MHRLTRLRIRTINPKRATNAARPRINIHRNLTRRLHRHQRMRRIILIAAHAHKRTPIDQSIQMRQARLRRKVVVLPPLDNRLGLLPIRGQERLHLQPRRERIHHQPRPVHGSLKRPQRRRHSQTHLLQTLRTVVIPVQPLILNSTPITHRSETIQVTQRNQIKRHHKPPHLKKNTRLSSTTPHPSWMASKRASYASVAPITESIFRSDCGCSLRTSLLRPRIFT